ncbi:SDR family oxidoreductase [Tropicimonas sp. IMCC34043]|uniref:SDR family NAD(P)-dependent oxidoreductase n=1 Tax=Tropicimonas sp. IMCC34043 TaxID=2248760 RepID=UPI000E2582EE|nr:SDR family NAD(P)-dependent oxidoreductase [Tropicimonas sp. IMCC34043]
MTHKALTHESVAVVTGGAAGIGLALAREFARMGMAVVVVDRDADQLEAATSDLRAAGARAVMVSSADVRDFEALTALEGEIVDALGGTDILVNNAGIQPGSAIFGPVANWQQVFDVNLWGPINGVRAFVPGMIDRGRAGMVINTGSKQGITTPPGDPAYNVAKAGLKAYTEALAHELRNTEGAYISVHLLIPGFVFTGLTRGTRKEKPAGAWTAEQTAAFAIERLNAGDFYILCPDNDVSRALDEKRMAWAMGDIIENRPPLSRWHPEFAAAFAAYVAETS